MAIKQKNVYHRTTYGYKLPGYATTEANYLLLENRSAAEEGDLWYDTTNNLLKTHDGSNWSPAGINSMSAGTLNAVAALGNTITIDGSTVTAGTIINATTLASGALLFLNNDDTSNDPVCLNIDNEADATTAVSIQIDGVAGYDIQGTSDKWDVGYDGDAMFHDIWVKDDLGVQFGDAASKAGDVSVIFHDGSAGTAGNGLLFVAVGGDEQIQFGDTSNTFDVWFCGETANTNRMLWDMNGGTNTVGALIFDNADCMLGDNDELIFGDVSDWVIDWDDTTLQFIPAADSSPIIMGSATRGVNLKIYGDTATSIFEWNCDNDKLIYHSGATSTDVAVMLDDFCQLTFGEGAGLATGSGDVQFSRDDTDFHLDCTADGEVWNIGTGSADFDIKWFASSTGDYVLFDEGNARVEYVDVDLRFNDDALCYFGSDSDISLQYDTSGETLDIIGNVAITGTLSVSGAFDLGAFRLTDDEELQFGNTTGGDFILNYDSSVDGLCLDAAAANNDFNIGYTTATDVVIHGANAARDLWWDANVNTLFVMDNAVLAIGTSGDIDIKSDNTNFSIDAGSANGLIDIGLAVDTDMRWHGAVETEDVHWDASEDTLCIISGAVLGFGNTAASPDFEFTYDGTDFLIEAAAAEDDMKFGETTNFDVTIYGGTNTNYFKFDTDDSALSLDMRNTHLIFEDGTATFDFINTSQVLLIEPDQDDRVIAFGRTNQVDVEFNGNTATYDMYWDASENGCLFADNTKLTIGGSVATPDLLLQSDGTSTAITLGVNSHILGEGKQLDLGAGGDTVAHGLDVIFRGATTASQVIWNAGDAPPTMTFGGTGSIGPPTLVFSSEGTVEYTLGSATNVLTLNGTDSASAKLVIGTSTGTNSMDIVFQSASSAGNMVTWAAGANPSWTFGGTSDVNVDVVFKSGTAASDVTFDAGGATMTFGGTAAASPTLVFTSSSEDVAYAFGSTTNVLALTATDSASAKVNIGSSGTAVTNGLDVVFNAATAASQITWDAGGRTLTFAGTGTAGPPTLVFASESTVDYTFASATNVLLLSATDSQSAQLILGTSGTNGMDILFQSASLASTITWQAGGNPSWTFGGTSDVNVDVVFQSGTAGDNITFDAGAKTLTATDCEIVCETESGADGTGLAIPINASTAPSTTSATGGRMVFEVDDAKLWVKAGTTGTWVGVALC